MRKVAVSFLVAVMAVIFLCFPACSKSPSSTTVVQGITLVAIPAGTFQMGQVGVAEPVHQVTVSAFQMGRYEVTQEQYQTVVGSNPSEFTGDTKSPVDRVSWYNACTFCNKLSEAEGLQPCYNLTTWACDFTKNGYSLPTEAEWEYACRAGTTTNYYTGDSESDLAKAGWYHDNSGKTTHPVGGKEANAFGLYDMHGNVSEWCNDWYGDYSSENANDPQGSSNGSTRVSRGGSWSNSLYYCRLAYRYNTSPGTRYDHLGFRVVRR
ncbi:MAG TPA: formylglycine-generating enzyme family protein [archaeon]|nr:formylglycine-generating enzyme family protein [archaeon]